MKAYFILKNFFEDSLTSQSAGIDLRTYQIGGVETLTPDFFIDTQSNFGNPIEDFSYCICVPDGTNPNLTTANPNSFNPFAINFGLNYAETNGALRGLPTGVTNGNDYGVGVMNFGVDIPAVRNEEGRMLDGAFFIDIDFSQSLLIKFDIVTNIVDENVYEEPQILRKYEILWDKEKCKFAFRYFDVKTNQSYNDFINGFLAGVWDKTDPNADPHIDFSAIPCGINILTCPTKERTRSFAMFVEIPTLEETAETIQECCYQAEVFAEVEGNDYEKNDFTGIYHKKQIPNETATFFLVNLGTMEEIELEDNTLGTLRDFQSIADNPNLKTFVIKWKSVLLEYGEGTYTLLKRVTIAGVDYEEANINYNLRTWSVGRADKSVRIDIKTNGLMERLGIDFINSNFTTSIRFGGFFGRREPKYEEDNIVYSNFESVQISMMQTNEYTLQSNLLPSCITQPVIDFLLFANDIYINDYNLNNHLRNLIKVPVKFADNKGTNYFSTTTKAVLNLTFSDKIVDNIKRNY